MDSEVDFRVLGPLRVVVRGQPVPVRAGRQRALLAALLLRAGSVVSVDELAERLWGDQPPSRTKATLQTYVMRLRQLLGDPALIRTVPEGYLLFADPDAVDALRFERTLAAGERELAAGRLARAGDLLRDALAMWHGPALADVPSEVLHRDEAPRLTERRLRALERRIEVDLALGRHAELATELRALTEQHPLRERFWAQLMQALHAAGRTSEALAAYQRIADRLADELGIDPGEELRAQHQKLLGAGPAEPAEPAAEPRVVPSQLPSDVGDFVGRARSLRQIRDLLLSGAGVPVVTVAGRPGIGKTALAVHVAHQLRGDFPDGQLYVNLRGYAPGPPLSTTDALSRFLRALGVAPEAVPLELDEQEALYRSTLDGRRVLVVLDNAATAEQIRPLLPGAPGSAVLVTSRDTLHGLTVSHSAHQVRLDTLSAADSRVLLAGMLGDAEVAAEPEATAELADLCAGLPLALRIAAANLANRPNPIAQYVAELRVGSRLAALAVAGDRQAAVHAAFALSYSALRPELAALFRLLSLVPGADVTAESAAALAHLSTADAARRLDELAGANLVDNHAPGRYQMHDLLREYAAERLAHDEDPAHADRAVRRLLDWCVRSVDRAAVVMTSSLLRLDRPDPLPEVQPMAFRSSADALTWLDAERPNLVAAVAHAADHGPWDAAWHLADALRGYFYTRGLPVEWLATAQAGLRAAQADGDPLGEGAMHSGLGTLYWAIGQHRRALEHYARSVPLQRLAGNREAEAAVLSNIGSVHIDLGELEKAAENLERALRITDEIDARQRRAIAQFNLGGVYLQLGQLDRAVHSFHGSLELGVALAAWMTQANSTRGLAEAYAELGELDQAADSFRRAQALYRNAGARTFEHTTHEGLAIVHLAREEYPQAVAEAERALDLCRELDYLKGECDARNQLGRALCGLGRHQDALAHHTRALEIAEETSYPWGVAAALCGIATVHLGRHTPDRALPPARRAVALVRESGLRLAEADALVTLGRVLAALDDHPAAHRVAREAVALTGRTGQRVAGLRALTLAARTAPDPADAARWTRAAADAEQQLAG